MGRHCALCEIVVRSSVRRRATGRVRAELYQIRDSQTNRRVEEVIGRWGLQHAGVFWYNGAMWGDHRVLRQPVTVNNGGTFPCLRVFCVLLSVLRLVFLLLLLRLLLQSEEMLRLR